MNNLNQLNANQVTPLTLAIEMNLVDIAHALLLSGANPLVENGHGNTPLSLLEKTKSKFDNSIFNLAISRFTIPVITERVGERIQIKNAQYEVTRIISSGECCIIVLVLKCCSTGDLFVLKIKKSFGGLEIRNYILLGMCIDLVVINDLTRADSEHDYQTHGLLQPFIPGISLDDFLTQTKDQNMLRYVMHEALKALDDLHNNSGCVHGDALPQNIIWDDQKGKIVFIDFEVLRTSKDLSPSDFETAICKDFARLLFGDNKMKPGFSSFYNVKELIDSLPNAHLKDICIRSMNITHSENLDSTARAGSAKASLKL